MLFFTRFIINFVDICWIELTLDSKAFYKYTNIHFLSNEKGTQYFIFKNVWIKILLSLRFSWLKCVCKLLIYCRCKKLTFVNANELAWFFWNSTDWAVKGLYVCLVYTVCCIDSCYEINIWRNIFGYLIILPNYRPWLVITIRTGGV